MKRNVGKKTVHVLRDLLRKRFEEELRKIHPEFRHDFSYEKPYFEFVIRLDAYDFATTVMETELLSLTRKLDAANKKIEGLEQERYHFNPESTLEIVETIHDFDDAVVAHQKKGPFHRLVLCKEPPQIAGAWVYKNETAYVGRYYATEDKVAISAF